MREREPIMRGTTTKFATEAGNLYITLNLDSDGKPFEVFGVLGKGGSFERGMTELGCRQISLALRSGISVAAVVKQCKGIADMRPWPNQMDDGEVVSVRGIGDCIAYVLKPYADGSEGGMTTC